MTEEEYQKQLKKINNKYRDEKYALEVARFESEQAEILLRFPEELRGAMGYYAYERGHGDGYDEVILYLRDLADALAEPLREFEKRIRKEKGAKVKK